MILNNTPLHLALIKSSTEIAQYILSNFSNILINEANNEGIFFNSFYDTLLHIACKHRSAQKVVILLLSYRGIDVNKQDSEGRSPIMIAQENKRYEIVKALINDFRTNLNVKDISII